MQYVYDDAGHRPQIIDALNHTTVLGYDKAGNQTSVTDANQHTTAYVYDIEQPAYADDLSRPDERYHRLRRTRADDLPLSHNLGLLLGICNLIS